MTNLVQKMDLGCLTLEHFQVLAAPIGVLSLCPSCLNMLGNYPSSQEEEGSDRVWDSNMPTAEYADLDVPMLFFGVDMEPLQVIITIILHCL